MKKIKLLIAISFLSVTMFAQGTVVFLGATITNTFGGLQGGQAVTVIDSSSTGTLSVYNYTTFGNSAGPIGTFSDTLFFGSAGTLYMFTTDSCNVTYMATIVHTPNIPTLSWFGVFTVCAGGISSSCNFVISAAPNATGHSFNSNYAGTSASTYLWDFGDSTTSISPYPTHTYAAPGTYTYCLQVDSCPAVCNTLVVGSPVICDATFTAQDSGLFVEIAPLAVGTTGHLEFNWGDGQVDTVNAAALPFTPYNHTYATAGIYTICVKHTKVANGAVVCSDVSCITVTVSGTTPFCNASYIIDTVNSFIGSIVIWNTSTLITTANHVNSFMWSFGDGNTSTQPFPTHSYANPGMYNICLTVTSFNITTQDSCASTYCDSLGVDANGNLIYKGASGWTLNVLDANSIGLDENLLSDIKSYPNPVKDIFTVELPESAKNNASLELYSVSGVLVKHLSASGSSNVALNMSDLQNGIYILHISANGQSTQLKVVKQD